MSADDINIRDALERAWRARWKIVCFQLFVVCATCFLILFWPRTYSSSALLYLQRGHESVGLDPTATTGKTIALQQAGRDAEIKSAIDVLSSRGISVPVVELLSPEVILGETVLGDADTSETSLVRNALRDSIQWVVKQVRSLDPSSKKERAIIKIERNLMVDAQRKSEIISVTFEAETPELAQAVTNAIVNEYRIKHANLHRTDGSIEFFEEQSKRLKVELEEAAERLRQAKSRMGITSIAEERTILAEQLGTLRTDMMSNDKLLYGAYATAKNVASQIAEQPERLSASLVSKPNSGADLQRQLFYALQIEEMDAKAKLTANHPKVRSLQQQVAEAKRELAKQELKRTESTDDVNPVHEQLRLEHSKNLAEIAGLEAKKEKLDAQEADLLQRIRKINEYAVEIDQLEREVNLADKKFLAYAENLEEARVVQAMRADHISSVSIAQPATLQEKPVSPSKPIVALCGALMCFAGPLAIGLFCIQTDDTLISEYSLRKCVDAPVLGAVPQSRAYSRIQA
jgi:uncharacterized protein involved in exopolysaccharide biosynthesis